MANTVLPDNWIWVRHLHSGEIVPVYKPNINFETMKNDFEPIEVRVENEEELIPEPTPFGEAVDVPKTIPAFRVELKKMGVMIPKGATKEELEALWREHI